MLSTPGTSVAPAALSRTFSSFRPTPPAPPLQAANIHQTISDAFAQPFALDEMIRLTFVTGAGKLARQKYDARAMPTLAAALRDAGYEEDRGASCVVACGGTYKTQHDTGKNLFTVVVFPRLAATQGGERAGAGGDGEGAAINDAYPLAFPLVDGSPAHTVLAASEETFAKMAPSLCPSWSEKKFCVEVLKAAFDTVGELDEKLMTGTPLSEDENEFYDFSGGAAAVAAKMEALKKLMAEQVDSGGLTQQEIDRLLVQVRDRIDTLNADMDAAVQRGHEKKAAQLTAQKQKAEARRRRLQGRAAQPPTPLKKEAQIVTLARKLRPLLQLEEAAKGRLMTMKETRELAAKEEIIKEIAALEEASRGWFEDDAAFAVRVASSRKRRAATIASGGAAAGKGRAKKPAAGPAWLTPGGLAAKQNALAKKAVAKKTTKRSNGNSAFAAMMADSDSDSE